MVKGDLKCTNIAAASILAKVTRDRIMRKYHARWPEYDFATVRARPARPLHGPRPAPSRQPEGRWARAAQGVWHGEARGGDPQARPLPDPPAYVRATKTHGPNALPRA